MNDQEKVAMWLRCFFFSARKMDPPPPDSPLAPIWLKEAKELLSLIPQGEPVAGLNGRPSGGDNHGWPIWFNVTCVECPSCGFTMDYDHTDEMGGDGGYTCPNCQITEMHLAPQPERDREAMDLIREIAAFEDPIPGHPRMVIRSLVNAAQCILSGGNEHE